jgi:hypothetical protein
MEGRYVLVSSGAGRVTFFNLPIRQAHTKPPSRACLSTPVAHHRRDTSHLGLNAYESLRPAMAETTACSGSLSTTFFFGRAAVHGPVLPTSSLVLGGLVYSVMIRYSA